MLRQQKAVPPQQVPQHRVLRKNPVLVVQVLDLVGALAAKEGVAGVAAIAAVAPAKQGSGVLGGHPYRARLQLAQATSEQAGAIAAAPGTLGNMWACRAKPLRTIKHIVDKQAPPSTSPRPRTHQGCVHTTRKALFSPSLVGTWWRRGGGPKHVMFNKADKGMDHIMLAGAKCRRG